MFADAYRSELHRLHETIEDCVKDLSEEQLHRIPSGHPRLNSIAFEFWHYVRTEDTVINHFLRGRQPTVWALGEWHERFGHPKNRQGTGMATEDAQALRISDMPAFLDYTSQVWASTDAFLDEVSEDRLREVITVPPLGELTYGQVLMRPILTHGFTHVGQIETMRVLLGLETAIGL